MVEATAGSLFRFLGVSLRPCSGHSPVSLIIRGVIHIVVCAFFVTLIVRGFTSGLGARDAEIQGVLRGLIIPALIALTVLIVIGVFRVVVGAIDLVPRQRVTGRVLSVRERKFGDFLPHLTQRAIFERNPTNIDRRREHTEVVLLTERGERRWTVRKRKLARTLTVGNEVSLTVTPIAGYVASIDPLTT